MSWKSKHYDRFVIYLTVSDDVVFDVNVTDYELNFLIQVLKCLMETSGCTEQLDTYICLTKLVRKELYLDITIGGTTLRLTVYLPTKTVAFNTMSGTSERDLRNFDLELADRSLRQIRTKHVYDHIIRFNS